MNKEQVTVALGKDLEPVKSILRCVRDHPELDDTQIALKLGIAHDECMRLILRAMEFGLIDINFFTPE